MVQRDMENFGVPPVIVKPKAFSIGLDDECRTPSHRRSVLQMSLHFPRRLGGAQPPNTGCTYQLKVTLKEQHLAPGSGREMSRGW